jgi:hypothetical protein
MHPVLRCLLGLAFATLAVHAGAGPVSQDAAAPSSDVASAASRLVSEDTGDAAKLARMVDDIARNAAASSASGRGGGRQASPKDSRSSSAKEGDRGDEGSAGKGPQRPAWLGGDDSSAQAAPPMVRGRADGDGTAPGALLDQVAPEERNKVRELVFMIKSVLYHPMTWVIGLVLIAGSVVLSAGGRRRK